MTFKEFVNNLNRAHDRGSFSLTLVYAAISVLLVFVMVCIMIVAPVFGFGALIGSAVARVVYAGLKGR